jgi:hypothetical protein
MKRIRVTELVPTLRASGEVGLSKGEGRLAMGQMKQSFFTVQLLMRSSALLNFAGRPMGVS